MAIIRRRTIVSRCSSIVFSLILGSAITAAAQDVFLCVWRNPERTMSRIFPDAADYRTVNVAITPAQRQAIEKELGFALLPGQRDQFQYFEMTGAASRRLGTIIAASQKGEFGAIEFVFGLDSTGTINGIYVQRARERDTGFKERAFLDGFIGKNLADIQTLHARAAFPRSPGTDAVVQGIIKELVTLSHLRQKGTR